MAGLFRKRQFKPWIASSVISKDKNLKSRVVKVLCRRSKSAQGSVVMLVSDGELSISAIFSEEAVDNALSNLGLGRDSSWDTALLILHEFTLELKMNPGQPDVGEFVLYVEKFNIWDLQPGYHAKFDVKYCMEHIKVREMMIEEIRDMKERAACQSQSNKTGSIALTQLLDEMAKPSESFSQSGCDEKEEDSANFTAKKCVPLTESLMEKLIQPFTVEEFLIPPSQATVLQNLPEWKPDYQPPSSVELEEDLLTVIDQQFDVCAANTLCSPPENVKDKAANLERSSREASQDVIYLGISVTPPEHPDTEEAKSGRRSPCPVNVLFKHSNMDSQSQGTSSQWQEEVDSVRFSFEEDLCTTATPESQEESQSQVHVGTSDRLCKHVGTVEKSSKQVAKETDGVKDCRALTGASLEKDSCKFVTEEILKEKSCSAVSEKGLERTGASSIKETEVVKTAISVTKRVEKLGMSLNQASAEKRSDKLESKKNKKEIDDLHLTKECGEERNHTVVTKGISEKEGDQIVTKEMKKENPDALVTKEYGEARDSTVVIKIILEKQVDNCVTKGKEKDALLTKEYSEESLDLGSPNAQSTQINEVEDISTKGSHRNIAEKVEELLDNTEENENDFQNRTKTNYSEIESVSQSLLLVESADNVLESQDNNNLKMYQRNVTHITAVNVDSSVLVKDENVDSEYEAKIDTSQGNASNSSLSDADKSIMLNYYSQNSSSPSHSWNNVLLRLAEKKKRLEALKYITNRISITIDEHDKEEDTETEKTWNNESFYGYIKEEIIRDVNGLCSDVGKSEESFNSYIKEEVIRDVNDLWSDAGRSEEPAYKDTEGRLVMVGEDNSKSNSENLSNQTENVTKGDSGDNKVLEGGDEDFLGFEDVGTLCVESKGILEETYNGDQSEMDTVDTTDTGYPIASLTLQESNEENDSCLLPSDNVLEQTDLEAVNRIHCENIAKYTKAHTREETDQESDQSDIEIIGHSHSHQRCTSYMKKETNAVSKEITSMKGVLNPCGKIKQETLNHNPLAPLYFETESGSTRRSKRLYAKVISCRQKDSVINSANMENSSAVSSRINDNSENSRKKIIERGTVLVDDGVVVERQISRQQDKQTDCVSNPNAESNLDANKETVVATEPVCEEEANKKSAKKTVNEDCSVQKYIGLKSQSNANFTSLRTGQVKDTYNADSSKQKATVWTRINENILKNVSETTDTKWNFKKDVRIMLERCDQQENSYMKGNKRRRRSSFGSCYKLSKSGNALQKPLVDGNQLKRPSVLSPEKASEKPMEGRNSLLKTKVKGGKVFRKESAETVCSMAVNFHCACCGSEEKIETGKCSARL
ncbi:uncharacterized protein LOC128545929 isoform X2 [Mercenaria mercenaria]|uniref:uncharacterized protein LOC128545929 isoform X2 n=1 Tax=Mercenaria mercenaria TaxID=6596 RepID=UPI00234F3161|nr:uncharacterized protein LOC128545929 isoform X2 [Mercenaria mercenaria]